ncbi:Diadenosine tetraphosphate (Ap4A) hydrolase [Actinokineospora alba]|uniref:Diadenosine tetraphosphate (Ap4A) hydrolase n=1 Tax=Actinokineospora alba TaxID=504798 RepID=A0A1H0QU90_9PSEU|nr:histidine triad (HIT) protein [Actinokineospora alba]TDP70416.1 diadenosine tetraphosphate (Ap4A) HIT family hydrolase [Actinokineospora alba]SDI32055.1 Diadenosine tetraphosphate (Ap4A) hydrolase [Actinokineospora alba]SDP20258.1 Diadenosine tetraphosphate (Ap4A) hydrolase [Actinokineospora alba]
MAEGCLICAKHRGEGPLVGHRVWADEHVIVSHRPVGDDGTTVLGYLFVESRRHAPSLDALTEVEAGAVARAAWRAARGLRAELDPEFVFSAIVGRAVAHFHQHLFARYRGTPEPYPWMESAQWPGAKRGGVGEVAELCVRLALHLD